MRGGSGLKDRGQEGRGRPLRGFTLRQGTTKRSSGWRQARGKQKRQPAEKPWSRTVGGQATATAAGLVRQSVGGTAGLTEVLKFSSRQWESPHRLLLPFKWLKVSNTQV